jgi:hypothetical protein
MHASYGGSIVGAEETKAETSHATYYPLLLPYVSADTRFVPIPDYDFADIVCQKV